MPDLPIVAATGAARSVDEHLAAVLAAIEPLPALSQPLLDALDLVAAADVVSGIDLPRFDNSAMDGYAVHHADVVTASTERPVTLPVIGEIGAGQGGVTDLPPGTAAKIMTGAPVPAGADAVVPYEWTDHGAREVWITQAPDLGQHVRGAGEDIATGDVLLEAGTTLGPRHLGLLAATGHTTVRVRPRPRVVIVSTGSELRDPSTPADDLPPDAIFDGNSYLLAAAARRAGAVTFRVGIVPDRPEEFLTALEGQLGRADAVITSGGISMGDYDVVKMALRSRESMWFGGVAMQPGKPQGFGLLPARNEGGDDGGRRVPFFALPGNPVSSYLSFELFVRPALRRMMGRTPESRTLVHARLTHRVRSPEGRRQLLRAALTRTADGWEVEPVGGPASHLMGDLANADAVIVVPEPVTEVPAGATVRVMRLDSDE